MINQDRKEAIKIIHKRLAANNIKWALAGSTNVQLQGMQVEPRDLDIVIQHKDLEKISRLFHDYPVFPVKKIETLSGESAWEVKATIRDVEVQFFGGDETEIYVSKLLSSRILLMKLDDIEIPCFTLEAESQAYMETRREHKANLIKEFLRGLK